MEKPNRKYQSCAVILIAILLIARWQSISWLTYVGLTLGILVLLFPRLAMIIDYLWMGLGKAMGRVVSPVLLGLVYFGILWPISLFSKRAKMNLMLENNNKSTFVKIEETINKDFFERTW